MAAKDVLHDAFKEVLQEDGWKITHDPLQIRIESVRFEVDLGGERIISAFKGKEKIAIEVKSFLHPSFFTDFHRAIGQYLNYKVDLDLVEEERDLYLAFPEYIYEQYFHLILVKEVVKRYNVKLILFNEDTKETCIQLINARD